jgi:hypothetical protein
MVHCVAACRSCTFPQPASAKVAGWVAQLQARVLTLPAECLTDIGRHLASSAAVTRAGFATNGLPKISPQHRACTQKPRLQPGGHPRPWRTAGAGDVVWLSGVLAPHCEAGVVSVWHLRLEPAPAPVPTSRTGLAIGGYCIGDELFARRNADGRCQIFPHWWRAVAH